MPSPTNLPGAPPTVPDSSTAESRNTITRLWRKIAQNQPFTTTGRVLAFACGFCFLAIIDDSLATLLSYLLWLLIFAFGCGLYFRPTLRVSADAVPVVQNGEQFSLTIEVENIGHRAAYDLECNLVEQMSGLRVSPEVQTIDAIEVGQKIRVSFPVWAERRGVFRLPDVQVNSLFPFALFRFIGRYELVDEVVIAPAFGDVPVSLASRDVGEHDVVTRLTAMRQVSVNEYVRSVEYRPGMAVRRWDFASWARLGNPTVRQFSDGTDASVAVVVDARRRMSIGEDPELEKVLSEAASVVAHVARREDAAVLVVVGEGVEVYRGGHFDPETEFLTRLAEVRGTTQTIDWRDAWRTIWEIVPMESSLILLTHAGYPPAQQSLAELRGHEHDMDIQVMSVGTSESRHGS